VITARGTRFSKRRESGLTLIESLVTIAIITVGVVGVAGAVGATERLAGINQDQSQLEVAMRHLTDFVRDSTSKGLAYTKCAQPSTYNSQLPAVQTPVTIWTITTVNVSPYPGGGTRGPSAPSQVATDPLQVCSGGNTGDWGVQEITLKVSTAQRSLTRTIWKSITW
jgi:prepilin-type N-terminal cleavage/methylation domain-containing protein